MREVTEKQRDQIQYLSTALIHAYANENLGEARKLYGRLCETFADIERPNSPLESGTWLVRAFRARTDEETDAEASAFMLGVICERIVNDGRGSK